MEPARAKFTSISASAIRNMYPLRRLNTIHNLQFFADDHLHERLLEVTSPLRLAAFHLVDIMEDGPELTMALRKMLEARDCFIRHYQSPHGAKVDKVII